MIEQLVGIILWVLFYGGAVGVVWECITLRRLLRQKRTGLEHVAPMLKQQKPCVWQLTPNEANSLLRIAMAPESYIQCNDIVTTHSSAVAINSLTARMSRDNIISLRNRLDVCQGEMLIEQDFTKGKLKQHLQLLSLPYSMAFSWTDDRNLCPAQGQNFFGRAFSTIPESQIVYQGVLETRQKLGDITGQMRDVLRQAYTMEPADLNREIRVLLAKSANDLRLLRSKLDKLIERVNSLVQSIDADWECDAKLLYEKRLCQSRINE